jgi:sulfoxide reductase heme-binding subunit YedZ
VVLASFVAWDVTRAAGIVAYVLLTLSVVAGLALSGRARIDGWPRFAVEDVHRFLGLLAGVFVSLHVLTLLLDDYVGIGLAGFVVPFASRYETLATGLGVVSLELLVALAISNRLRPRIPHRLWRRLHYVSFGVWAAATAHGVLQGTDTGSAWVALMYAVSVGAVCALAAWRSGQSSATGERSRPYEPDGRAARAARPEVGGASDA